MFNSISIVIPEDDEFIRATIQKELDDTFHTPFILHFRTGPQIEVQTRGPFFWNVKRWRKTVGTVHVAYRKAMDTFE